MGCSPKRCGDDRRSGALHPPDRDQLEPEQIRHYQAHPFRDRELFAECSEPVNRRSAAALHHPLEDVLKHGGSRYPKRDFRLSNVLSQSRAVKLIESALRLK